MNYRNLVLNGCAYPMLQTLPDKIVHTDQSASGAVRNVKRRHELAENGKANKRSVWHITPIPYPGAHFATFPEELPELCIKAGTSEKGCCPTCHAPYKRILKKAGTVKLKNGHQNKAKALIIEQRGDSSLNTSMHTTNAMPVFETAGWQPSCACESGEKNNDAIQPCIVLDMFGGSGTTAATAHKAGAGLYHHRAEPAICGWAHQKKIVPGGGVICSLTFSCTAKPRAAAGR